MPKYSGMLYTLNKERKIEEMGKKERKEIFENILSSNREKKD